MILYRYTIPFLIVFVSGCNSNSKLDEYYDNGSLKSRVETSGDTLITKYYYESKDEQLKTLFKLVRDTVYIALYFDQNGGLAIQSQLENRKVNLTREKSEWLIGPQNGAKYLSVIYSKPFFPIEINEHLMMATTSDGLFVHLPDSAEFIRAVLFEQEIDIFTDSTAFFHGTHTYFSIP